jgi:hypothetical protein
MFVSQECSKHCASMHFDPLRSLESLGRGLTPERRREIRRRLQPGR